MRISNPFHTHEDVVVFDILESDGPGELVDETEKSNLQHDRHILIVDGGLKFNERTITPYMAMPFARALVWRHSTG